VFSYPADAGQNYEVLAEAGGMASLVIVDNGEGVSGGWKLIDNPRYVSR
jgi:glucose-6-phosphate isomerase